MTRTTRTLTASAAIAGLTLTALAPTALAAPAESQQRERTVAERAHAMDPTHRTPGHAPLHLDQKRSFQRQAILQGLVTDGAFGVVARVESPKGTWQGGAGVRERGKKGKPKGHERFRAASNTKPMVATLVMQEVAKGTWTLDTTVESVLPGTFPGHPDVTIRQLLSHTSGAPTGDDVALAKHMDDPNSWSQMFTAMQQPYAPQDIIDGANAMKWGFPEEGPKWRYSNAGYVVLGQMLEAKTGQRLGDLLERRVFKPAGMHHTRYETNAKINGPWLIGGNQTPDGYFSERGFNPTLFGAAGAVSSTTKDLNRFSEALVTGQLLDRDLVAQMTADSDNPLHYGLGTFRFPDPCSPKGKQRWLVGHNGGSYGTTSMMFSSPDGRRQGSIATTGRYYKNAPPQTQPYDMEQAYSKLVATTC